MNIHYAIDTRRGRSISIYCAKYHPRRIHAIGIDRFVIRLCEKRVPTALG